MAESHGGGCCPPMDLMRSEPMQLVQVIVPMESAHLTVSYLGDLGLVQFKDVRTLSLSLWSSVHVRLLLIWLIDKFLTSIVLGFCWIEIWSGFLWKPLLIWLFWCWIQLNSDKSPFQRTYAAQVRRIDFDSPFVCTSVKKVYLTMVDFSLLMDKDKKMWRDGAKDAFLQRPNVKGRSFS